MLSGFGMPFGGGESSSGALLQDLNNLGVITSPVVPSAGGTTTTSSQNTQLQKDEQTLQTEFQTLSANSGVSVKDLTQLQTDASALGSAWYGVSNSALQTALKDVAAAATGSTTVSAASAKSEITGLFPASDSGAAGTLFNDLTQVVADSAVGTSGLSTVASDQAAVTTDLSNLGSSGGFGRFGFGGNGGAFTGPSNTFNGNAASSVLSALSNLGVVTNAIVANPAPTSGATSSSSSQNSGLSQLIKDEQAFQTELQTLSSGSGVTVADLTHLQTDAQALGTAWLAVSESTLQQALSDLTSAATGSTTVTTAQAQSEFTGLFPTSDQTAATTVFNDVVKLVQDSGVTASDLTTVAADETAIKTDQTNLHNGNTGSSTSGSTSSGSTTTGGSSSSTTSSGTSTTPSFGVFDRAGARREIRMAHHRIRR